MTQPKDLARKILTVLDDRKAEDILLLSVHHLTIIADYFVICSGRSSVQVRALCDEVDEKLAAQGIQPARIDGKDEARWIVLDYGSVVVHIFGEQEREFYRLERLWTDGSNSIPVQEVISGDE